MKRIMHLIAHPRIPRCTRDRNSRSRDVFEILELPVNIRHPTKETIVSRWPFVSIKSLNCLNGDFDDSVFKLKPRKVFSLIRRPLAERHCLNVRHLLVVILRIKLCLFVIEMVELGEKATRRLFASPSVRAKII